METKEPLLRVRKLNVGFTSRAGYSPAVMDASFDIEKGKVTALVGESGSGKSVTALSILRLLPEQAVITADVHDLPGADDQPESADEHFQTDFRVFDPASGDEAE